MKDTIVRIVKESVGITHNDLLIKLQANYGSLLGREKREDGLKDVENILDELVRKGQIVRVQFVIPPNGHPKMRSGALYLPERSVVIVNAQNDRTHFKSQR